jgi:ATP-dependent Clp protease, protease subunit
MPWASNWSGGSSVREESIEELLARRLFEQRVVQLRGPVDDLTAGRAAAELMTLDADGDTAVTLRLDSADGSLGAALTLMDVIELLGVPVNALCLGQVGGPAIGVLAVCTHCSAMPSTRFRLNEPRTQAELHSRNVAQWAELRADERRRFCERIGAAVGKSADAIAEDLRLGTFFTAEQAVTYGLLDEICRPEAEIHQLPGPPMGFRPRR